MDLFADSQTVHLVEGSANLRMTGPSVRQTWLTQCYLLAVCCTRWQPGIATGVDCSYINFV
jgi:hypothetical protein